MSCSPGSVEKMPHPKPEDSLSNAFHQLVSAVAGMGRVGSHPCEEEPCVCIASNDVLDPIAARGFRVRYIVESKENPSFTACCLGSSF